ncbi:hypothetical protein BU24DRAFT_411945 [Aaosphaeria arxii CBS 175.79]|uniref:Uncharacterized protein n=1 Tax=Aaosphaeria arxii CBS 175.79 TaxID=1450172 RepID=A0A6A5XIC2_9PLEO|nr:uncharacterized protein BU24DRAFT_411945 [Aaosphaeria arxii CBS 175.79]KAF2012597.1 hypothetical protein BU24DRAFT_411945 [Aaosphaeria arxii CBS 175.79]
MVTWGPAQDAIILLGIMEFMDIKASTALLEHLAEKIGDKCTPKAVSHRLNKLKAEAKNASAGTGASSAPGTPSSSKPSKVAKTPKSTARTTPGKGRNGTATPRSTKKVKLTSDEDADPIDELQQSPSGLAANRKRSRAGAAASQDTVADNDADDDDDEVFVNKKIKVEGGFDGLDSLPDSEDEGVV